MNTKLLSLIFFLAVSLLACKNENSSAVDSEQTEEAFKYSLTPFSNSPEFADAAIQSMEFNNGKFNFGVGGESYQLGAQTPDAASKMCANSGEGQHIHLIVDNAPYAAKYTPTFEYEIPDGEHYLLAFLSRSYHESIKTSAAHVAQKVQIAGNSITTGEKIENPMLFYSRPKGTYVGKDAEKVMLDFYLCNTTISQDGNMVKAEINGETQFLSTWQPYYIEGLPMGENTITLSLVDKDGNLVDTPLNPVTRKFTLAADPAPAN